MKRTTLALTLVLAFIILLLVGIYPAKGDIVIRDSKGTEVHFARGPYITFPSNTSYDSGLQTLYVNFHALLWGNLNYSMSYSLDRESNETVPLVRHYFGMFELYRGYLDGSVDLPALSNGSHCIAVYLECTYETWDGAGSHINTYFDSQTVHFTVLSPIVVLMENQTYNSTEIPLSFYVNGAASQIAYSLDNQANVTITGNTTLTGLTEGTHRITIYAVS